ncbi:MAG: hypothetical protein ACRDRF_19690, partial [Pseudonocardiaceae bacterium]
MIPAEVDAVLAELAEVVTGLIRETAHAERELDTCSLESDRFVEASEYARKAANPRRALASVHEELASTASRVLRDAGRDLASWWADAATHATAAVVAGKPVLPERLALADPGAYLDADDLGFLPPAPEDVLPTRWSRRAHGSHSAGPPRTDDRSRLGGLGARPGPPGRARHPPRPRRRTHP